MSFEQKHLNVSTRAKGYVDIMMYTPDDSISVKSISANDVLEYSDINSILDIQNYTSNTLATLEENLWVLNGTFVNPTPGRKYNGYISNSMSNETGHFSDIIPTITIDLETPSYVDFFTVTFNPAVKSGYPKSLRLICYDADNNNIKEDVIDNSQERLDTLPNLTWDLHLESVAKITLEFFMTNTPYRRIRIANIMFGKMITLDQDEIISVDYIDKCSYVPDSIPSRTFSFTVNNYSKKYNIDNPDNSYISLDRRTRVTMRTGYDIAGYKEDEAGNGYIDNSVNVPQIEWDEWKEFRLLNVSTSDEDSCTFECGSILDMMTDVYTEENFTNDRTVYQIINKLISFVGLSEKIIQYDVDETGESYSAYNINTVLPELPVRELIQLLAFSVGATLMINNDGTIKFKHINLSDITTFNKTHSFTYKDFLSTPTAQQLESTSNISIPKYNSSIDREEKEITTVTVSAYNTEVTYSECVPTSVVKKQDDVSGGSIQDSQLYARKGILTANLPEATSAMTVVISGYPIKTIQTQERSVTKDTLIIDTQLMSEDTDDHIKNKYKEWYSKKFKYTVDTRGEPLVDAGDYCEIETPFSGTEQLHGTFVLQNHLVFDGAWSGDMEVIVL